MPRNTDEPTHAPADIRSNTVTILGSGNPISFELTVDGTVDLLTATDNEPTISEAAAEGAIDTGVIRLAFNGEMANLSVINHGGLSDDAEEPTVHVEYGSRQANKR